MEKKQIIKNEEESDLFKSLDQINDEVAEQEETLNNLKDKDLIALFGNTGSGKSTVTNFLMGSKLEKTKKKGQFGRVYILKKGEKEFCKIGEDNKTSETSKIHLFVNEKDNFNILDTPGFLDSRGIDQRIVLSLIHERIFEKCDGIKFIFTLDYFSLCVGKQYLAKKTLNFIKKLFGTEKNIEKYKKSIFLLITKPQGDLEDLKEDFLNSDCEIREILENRVFFYHPEDTKKEGFFCREEFLEELNKMKFIKNKDFFQFPFDEELKTKSDKFFQLVIEKINLNNKKGEHEKWNKFYHKLFYFQNRKNVYFKYKFNVVDNFVNSILNTLQNNFIKFCNAGFFKQAKKLIKFLSSFLKNNDKFRKNNDINFDEYYREIKKKTEDFMNENQHFINKNIKEIKKNYEKMMVKEKNSSIKILLKEFKNRILSIENDFKKEIAEIDRSILESKKQKDFVKVDKLIIYKNKSKLLHLDNIKKLKIFHEKEIQKAKDISNSIACAKGGIWSILSFIGTVVGAVGVDAALVTLTCAGLAAGSGVIAVGCIGGAIYYHHKSKK